MTAGQYLTFLIDGDEYAVSILRVREIIEYEDVTRVPTTPPHVRGVIDLRGTVLPVIDLGVKFGRSQRSPDRTTCIVIVETRFQSAGVTVGVIADSVSEVIDLERGSIERAPAMGDGIPVEFLHGLARFNGRLALVLNPDTFLSQAELPEALAARSQSPVAAG